MDHSTIFERNSHSKVVIVSKAVKLPSFQTKVSPPLKGKIMIAMTTRQWVHPNVRSKIGWADTTDKVAQTSCSSKVKLLRSQAKQISTEQLRWKCRKGLHMDSIILEKHNRLTPSLMLPTQKCHDPSLASVTTLPDLIGAQVSLFR